MKKKFGGTIKNWQVHNLSYTKSTLRRYFPNENLKLQIVTATVVNDPTGRWQPGYHMRSSLIVKIDRKNKILETKNTIYKLSGKEGTDIFKDLNNDVLKLFY